MTLPFVKQDPADGTTDRPQRADARRNRERVLEAAEVLFAGEGLKVQIEQVAHKAGVGVGTVCRNFPTKQHLVDAVLTGMCEALLADAEAALAEPDPGVGFERFVAAMADFQVRHLAFAEEMAAGMDVPTSVVAVKKSLRGAIDELVSRAQRCGALRSDIGPGDISMLFSGIAHAAAMAGEYAPVLRQRYLAIVMDGLRPLNPTPLPGRPIGLAEFKPARREAQRPAGREITDTPDG